MTFWAISGIIAWSLIIGAVILFGCFAAINRSRGRGECQICVDANLPELPTWEPGQRWDLAYLFWSQVHKRIFAKLPAHRRAWQAMYDRAGDTKRAWLEKSQPRYGVRTRRKP